jgi:methylmalonyl-CoA mutase N-terminal domain/subunit
MDQKKKEKLRREKIRWEEETLDPLLERRPERLPPDQFSTVSSLPIRRLYTGADLEDWDADRDLAFPGEYPYTRGVQPTMYRGRLWTMRQFAGFGMAEDTNRRFRYLLDHGQTGLSTAFDMPTLMGLDSDDPRSDGEVGVEGVAVTSLADMETLFEGIPLGEVSTSMTINAPASVLLAMYVVVAEKQGVDSKLLRGTLQNDIFKEYIAQKEWIYPPRPHLRLITDMMAWCAEHMPKWNTISISGYHIREAGSTAVQELAFTLADGIGYVQAGIEAGMNVDTFAPRLSYFFNSHNDFFEEICKLRAARRIWARTMKERFGAKSPESWKLRTHVQTAGCSLTAQQPHNNIVRVAYQAMAAVLGGTQSLHTNSMDETLALPSEEAVMIALRTQQVLAEETGVANTVDPLAGSYFVESLTDEMESHAMDYIHRIDEMGGILAAIEEGFPQREIADAAYLYQQQLESGEKTMVGVNKHLMEEDGRAVDILRIGPEVQERQLARLNRTREERDSAAVEESLTRLRQAAESGANTFPAILDAVRSYATLGEMCGAMKEVFGEYREAPVF